MTHFVSSSRTTSDTSRSSASALLFAASHRSRGTRSVRDTIGCFGIVLRRELQGAADSGEQREFHFGTLAQRHGGGAVDDLTGGHGHGVGSRGNGRVELGAVGDVGNGACHAHIVHTNVNTRKGSSDGIVLLCERCGRPFQTDVIRALCGACQRAQEVAG